MGVVRIGTASWTDKTLLESGWYPPEVSTPEQRLEYYAGQFPLVEVDSTYYTPPSERNARLWAERTPAGFTFNIKAFSLFTQHPTKVSAIYKDVRPDTDKRNVYLKDLDAGVVDEIWARFLSALSPLAESGRLGAILLQFPHWFVIGSRNREYLLRCQERCAPYPVCIEFRHESWMSERNRQETTDFLRSHALPYVCVDMPQGYRSSVPPVVEVTAPLSVVRFHGHSRQWESKNIYERFGYRYDGVELQNWVGPVQKLAEDSDQVHVLFNNCYRNYAQANARELIDLLPDTLF
ncbi:MAG TPA: DUF72 domain-containing protein [Kineosporiaceae bacterium]|nr:DUF72 domain-containing protein [Kineosporiaceae bacterium]